MKNTENKILAILAHPDDETLFSGTLALLADKNISTQIVYATSGDAGRDATGQNLSGNALAIVREEEARESLKTLCLSTPPIFLKYHDGDLKNKLPELKKNVSKLINNFNPNIIITFGPDGVSGHPDHIAIGAATDFVFDTKENVEMLLHIAVSETRTKIYNSVAENYLVENAVSDKAINLKIDVEKHNDKRLSAAITYKTQFTENDCNAIGELIKKAPYEEFIIARKRGTKVDLFNK